MKGRVKERMQRKGKEWALVRRWGRGDGQGWGGETKKQSLYSLIFLPHSLPLTIAIITVSFTVRSNMLRPHSAETSKAVIQQRAQAAEKVEECLSPPLGEWGWHENTGPGSPGYLPMPRLTLPSWGSGGSEVPWAHLFSNCLLPAHLSPLQWPLHPSRAPSTFSVPALHLSPSSPSHLALSAEGAERQWRRSKCMCQAKSAALSSGLWPLLC